MQTTLKLKAYFKKNNKQIFRNKSEHTIKYQRLIGNITKDIKYLSMEILKYKRVSALVT